MDGKPQGAVVPAHPMRIEEDGMIVTESPRRTPVAADVDVLVIGGGPTGVGAALAAARSGARTVLIERYGMLGGVWTAGLLNPFFDASGKGWLVSELVHRLQHNDAWRTWKWTVCFDTEVMKWLLDSMMEEAGVDVWLYSYAVDTIVENGRVRGAVIESKSGREAILARTVIDCSGDGDVAARAGARYDMGRMDNGMCQPMTLMFEVDGVGDYIQEDTFTLFDQMQNVIRERNLDIQLPFGRVNYAPWFISIPRSDGAVVQATHVYQMNALSTRDLSHATRDARRQTRDFLEVVRAIPGLEKVRLLQTAAQIGVREARRIRGRYTLDLDDLREGRRFEDGVTFGAFGIDIHDVDLKGKVPSAHHTRMQPYEIPYRCLLPEEVTGLLVAGRCISGSHEAHASYRVTGTCMGMGQAAGLAGAMAAAEGVEPHRIDGKVVRRALENRGVGFLD